VNGFDQAPDEVLPPGLHQKVLEEFDRAAATGGGDTSLIGLRAWQRLDPQAQARQMPSLLGCYVRRVIDEENSRLLDRAARDTGKSYLGDFDLDSLTDSLFGVRELLGHGIDVDVTVNAEALANVLAELELVQHRLAMRSEPGTADG
jgi:hypothetical protein